MVAVPVFVRLNEGWNADPNVPTPQVLTENSTLRLRFASAADDTTRSGAPAELCFDDCLTWRLGATNDEGWYLGQCRYSRFAPRWGEFYALTGEDGLLPRRADWCPMPEPGKGEQHFLFYFRDEIFECYASNWSLANALNISG